MNTISQVWPEWKVEKEIGKGSHGTVYKCFKEENGAKEYSAVKVISVPQSEYEMSDVISEKMTNDQSKAYYKDIAYDLFKEIEILKELKGTKNIVEIYDAEIVEKDDGIGWYILIRMELLTDFNTYSSDKKFTEAEVIKLGMDLCSALSVCHKARIIHRDVKPENIFVDAEGNYKLGDFGVAKQLEKTQGSMSVKGTYDYMSPEVFGGKKGDGRADLYSLAIVMYKLLNNNRLPFLDPNKQLIRYSERQNAFEKRIKGVELPAIKNVSKELNAIILKACAFKNTDRQKNIDVFGKQLEKLTKEKRTISKGMLKVVMAAAIVAVCGSLVAAIMYGTSDGFKNSINGTDDTEITETQTEGSEYKRTYNQVAVVDYYVSDYNCVNGKHLVYDTADDSVKMFDSKNNTYVDIYQEYDLNKDKTHISMIDDENLYIAETENIYDVMSEYSIYKCNLNSKEKSLLYTSDKGGFISVIYCDDENIYFKEYEEFSNEDSTIESIALKRYNLNNKTDSSVIEHNITEAFVYNGYIFYMVNVNGIGIPSPLWVYDTEQKKPNKISEVAFEMPKDYIINDDLYFCELYEGEENDNPEDVNVQISKYNVNSGERKVVSDLKKSGLTFTQESGATYVLNDNYAVLHNVHDNNAYIWSYEDNTCREIETIDSEYSKWSVDWERFVTDKRISENMLYVANEGYGFKLYEVLPTGEVKQLGNELFIKEADIRTFGSKLMYFGQGGKTIEVKDFFKDGLSEKVEYTECDEMVYANSKGPGTNIRIAPILDQYTFIDYLKEGESLKRVAMGSNGWSKVIYNDELVYAKSYNLDLLTATDEDISLFTNMMANIIYEGIDEYYNDETEYYAVATSELDDSLPIVNVDNYELNGCVYTLEVSARFKNSDETIASYCVSAVLKSSEDGRFWEIESINVNPSYDAKLYREFLDTNYAGSDKQYSVYDMNNDGKKELIIYGKTKKNQTKCEVFSVINAKVISIGEFIFKGEYLYESTLNTLSYSEHYSESNAIEEGQGIEVVLVSVNDNTISETNHTYKAEELILNRLIKLPVDNDGLLSY